MPGHVSPPPEIKFAEILTELIESSPYRKNRKAIWEELNITSAALSQYLKGTVRPRFEVLVALAHFFGVSLDYLMLGKEESKAIPEDARPFVRHVYWELADVQHEMANHGQLISNIGRQLALNIDKVARELSSENHIAGMLSFDDQILIESYSLHTKVLCTNLEYDLIFPANGDAAAGRFMHILAENVKSNPPRQYEYLLPQRWDDQPWEEIIHTFRRVLANELGLSREQMTFCKFRRTNLRSFCGNVFYKLDIEALKQSQPILWQTLSPYISENGWIGHLLSADLNTPLYGCSLYGIDYLGPSLSLFNEWWDGAREDI